MRKLNYLIFVLLILTLGSVGAHPILSDNYVALGKGCTTAYYIDGDCDGYGVGVSYVLGPDADDADASVNNLASVEAKYGSMTSGNYLNNIKSFLCTVRGYCNIQNIYFISPTGNDGTGAVNDISKPYLTFATVKTLLSPGDLVLYRQGTHINKINCQYGGINGADGAPLIIMSYPGELATFEDASVEVFDNWWWIFDNLRLNRLTETGSNLAAHNFANGEFRYIETSGGSYGYFMMQNNHNILCEKSIFRDSGMSHAVYWGARDLPNSDLIFRDNIIYNGAGAEYTTAFQHNGPVTNLLMEGNIIHSSGSTGVAWLGGVDNSIFRNNLIFNNNKYGFALGKYSELYGDANNDNNLIVNNVIWCGQYENNNGEGYGPYSPINFYNSLDNDAHTGNIIRNNLLVSYDKSIFSSIQKRHIESSTVENNVFYRLEGTDEICGSSDSPYTWTFAEFEAISSSIKNNLNSNPLFTDVSVNYNLNPENFNFDLTQNSPAINFGILTGAPTTDLRGDLRIGNPDAGCYEYISGDSWSTTQLQDGTGSNKLSIIFIPSGFTSGQSSIFETEVQNNLNQLWQNNFFNDFRQRFDVYQVIDQYDSDGNLKTFTEINNLISTYDSCGFGDNGICKKIHIVIEDTDQAGGETLNNFIQLFLNSDNLYTIAHEISVHVLGNLIPYGGPLMKDEYLDISDCALNNYTYLFINAHDKNSNEKWSDLESGDPFLGSAYCEQFYRPSQNSIARGSNNKDCDNVGYRAAEIGLSKRTQDGGVYDENIPPSVSVSGISSGTTYSAPTNIQVSASDASGIDRVEFYISIDGEEFWSIGIDRITPYSHLLDLSGYSGTEYYLRVYVFDKAWNSFGGNQDGLQYGPIYDGSSTCLSADTDCNGIVDRGELGICATKWVNNQTTRNELAEAIMVWAG